MKLTLRDVLVRAWQRGYEPDEIRDCIVADLGDGVFEVDTSHDAYPAIKKGPPVTKFLRDYLGDSEKAFPGKLLPRGKPIKAAGPGTELKKILRRVGITAAAGCSCNARARTMDAKGCDWCEANIGTVVGWLREEAGKRRLPFLDAAGHLLVRLAIRNARKATEFAKAPPETA